MLFGFLTFLTACDRLHNVGSDNYDVANDSVRIAQLFENLSTPQFSTVNEVIEYRNNVMLQDSIDAMFMSLPEEKLVNVVSVLIKKNFATITKKDILDEYVRCKNVYDNLPSTSDKVTSANESKDVNLGSTDLGNRRSDSVVSTSYSFRTDTINGKPVRIKIKTEESYE